MLIKPRIILFTLQALLFTLLILSGQSLSKKVDIEAVRYVKNPQIQKFFTETHQNWEEVEEKVIMSSTRIPSWSVLDEKLEPIQKVCDLSEISSPYEDPFRFNYFELATDQSQPLYKASEPGFTARDDRASDLQKFKFDPPFLNFTESTLYVTSVRSISIFNNADNIEIKMIANRTNDPQLVVMHEESFNKLIKPGFKHKIKVGFIPTSLKNAKSSIIFTINLLNNKRVIATRNFIYDVYVHGVENPFKFTHIPLIRLYTGETWDHSLSIFNPQKSQAFQIENVEVDDEELDFRVPWDVNDIIDDETDNDPTQEAKKMSIIWDIAPQKQQKFLALRYKSETVGLKKINLFIDTKLQNFTIPLIFKVKPRTLILDKELYDLGIVTNPKIPHELQMNITNIFNYTIQILEIYASVTKDTYFRVYTKENRPILNPLEENKTIAKLRLLPNNDLRTRHFEGKILIQTNDTGIAHFIEAKYRYGYYHNMIVSSASDLSYFVRMQGENIYTDKKDTFNFVETGNGFLELFKPIEMTNSFVTTLEFQRIHFPTDYLGFQSYKNFMKLPIYQKLQVFELKLRLPIEDLNLTHFNTWFALESQGMMIPMHVLVYDKRLYCSMNIEGEDVTEKCYRVQNISLDFGFVATNEVKRKTLTLINYNPSDVSIVSVNCSIPNCFTDVIEASLEYIMNENNEVVSRERKIIRTWENDSKPVLKNLAAGYKAVFSFLVDKSQEEYQHGEIFINTVDESIRLPLKFQTLQGNLTFTPQIVRFQPAFPGKKQEASVAIRNLFNTTVNIKHIEAENPEIQPILTNPLLHPNERVEAFKIIFDPSKNKQVIESLRKSSYFPKINFLNTATSSGAYMYGITLDDLYAWKQGKNIWDNLISSSSTEIRDWVKIVNDISEKTFVQVRASVTNPLLIKEPINFGVTKVHSQSVRNITIENPSDLPIYVQLFIGPEEFSDVAFVSQIYSGEDANQGSEEKHIFCLNNMMLETGEDDAFVKAFLEDTSFKRYTIKHVNLLQEATTKSDVHSEDEDELSQYLNNTYHCVEGNTYNVDALKMNYTEKFIKRLIHEEDQPSFELLHSQNFKDSSIYEIKAMSYAVPKPLKAHKRAQTLFEKITIYFQSWFDFEEVRASRKVSLEQAALMEKLKQNIKEIYVQNFNSLQKEQQIFLNPKYRDLSILIPPHSHLTIPALIHQPNSNKEHGITLYIKNNLTSIFQVPIKATGGSGNLLVTDVKRYDDLKKNFVRSTEELLEGDVDQKKMKFYIDKSEIPMVETVRCEECPPGTKKLRLDRPFRRRFTLKNDGNLPLQVTGISIQNSGCEGYGFRVEDCKEFTLEPNQEHELEITFIPDMSLTFFTRTLGITTNQGIFEFELHVRMPFKHLYDNFDIYHFKTKFYIKIACYLIILGMAAMCYKSAKEVLFKGRKKQAPALQIYGQDNLNYKHPNEIFENVISVKHNLGSMIPAAASKMFVTKKAPLKPEKPLRTSKTPIKHNEFKEETAVNLNKFEDSDNENYRGMKFEEARRKPRKKDPHPKVITTHIEDDKQFTQVQTKSKPAPIKVSQVAQVQESPQEPIQKKPIIIEKPAPVPVVEKITKAKIVEKSPEEKVSVTSETASKVDETPKDTPNEGTPVTTTVPEKKTLIIIKEERKPYGKKTFERRQYEKKQYERKQYERKLYEKKKQEVEVKPEVEEEKPEKPVETEKNQYESEHDHDHELEEPKRERVVVEPIRIQRKSDHEEEKKSEDKHQEETDRSAHEKFEAKPSISNQDEFSNSDDDLKGEILKGEILDAEATNAIESAIERQVQPIGSHDIGFIGSKTNNNAGFANPFNNYVEPAATPHQGLDHSMDASELTSEDDSAARASYYNYFGNFGAGGGYPAPQTNQYDPFQSYSRPAPPSQYSNVPGNNNNNMISNMPGLGLFQTKRRTSRYGKYNYFPASTTSREKNLESPRRGPNVNRTPFYTGSEDESGVISESSISSKPFYHRHDSIDEEKPHPRQFNIPAENNPFSFAQMFFPNMENISSATKSNADTGTPFFEPQDKDYELGSGFDENKLSYIFGGGVRFRNLQEGGNKDEPDSTELPPGLH